MKNDKIRKTLNILLAIAVFGAWGQMVTAVSLGLGWLFRKVRFRR